MRVELEEIEITTLRLRTFIGFNLDERFKRQDVVINLRIKFWTQRGNFQGCVADALNYKSNIMNVIAAFESGRFLPWITGE